VSDLAAKAQALRDLHRPGDPLVLANAWDAITAKNVEAAGFPAVATTSAGVAIALGYEDHELTPPDEMFAAVARIASAVEVPVTADLESGYGLGAAEFVERVLDAGIVGVNFEDTVYRRGEPTLLDANEQATRIAELRRAARAAGVDIVINARTDAYLRDVTDPFDTTLERGRLYLGAGADCVYPIAAGDEREIERFGREFAAVNILLRPGAPDIERLAELRVARISVGGGLAHVSFQAHKQLVERVRDGQNYW
jgi:2-methylisocitrate lyase-like PEP mutase family enzyme